MAEDLVVVVGGGLAGITAALELADAGRRVVLVEKRPRLGGAAFSFDRAGLSVDNGQHVFLRCCTAYRALVHRLNGDDDVLLQPRLDIPVLRPDGRRGRIWRIPGVPAPAHLAAAVAGYRLLTPRDRLRAARAALAMRRLDPADRTLDERTFGGWLRQHGQNRATIEALWGIVGTATLNLPPDEASLALAARVFRTGLLDEAPAADIGYAAAPLGQLHSTRAGRALESAGVEVLTGCAVTAVEPGGAVTARSGVDELSWQAASVVLAVPPRTAFALAPALAASPVSSAASLSTSAIVNVHVIYDRKVTDLPFAAAVSSPVQWVFDRSESSGLRRARPQAQYLAVTVSAADSIVHEPSASLQQRFIAALSGLFPDARRARVLDAWVTRQREATFRQAPGTWALRPPSTSGVEAIYLAGAWTDTGWPDTMEGAVRSGSAAAQAVLDGLPASVGATVSAA